MTVNRNLILFAKYPALGAVKRRLAAEIGGVEAVSAYRTLLAQAQRRLRGDPRWRCWLAVTPDGRAGDGAFWLPDLARFGQGSGDLGRRMGQAMTAMPAGPVVLIGTDIPGVRTAHIARGFECLRWRDAVFGPAADGGFWLVGFKQPGKSVAAFENVRWSTRHALADVLANLAPDQRVGFVEELFDVDDAAAHKRWRRKQ